MIAGDSCEILWGRCQGVVGRLLCEWHRILASWNFERSSSNSEWRGVRSVRETINLGHDKVINLYESLAEVI